MVTKLSPLAWNVPIVDELGNPTPYFQQMLQQWLNEKATTDELASTATPESRLINTTTPISGGGDLSADLTLTHDNSGVTADTYGDSTHVPQITVDDKGHVTDVTEIVVSGGGSGGIGFSELTTSSLTLSTSAFATKGNIFVASTDISVLGITIYIGNTGTYLLTVATLDSGDVIQTIVSQSLPQVIPTANTYYKFELSAAAPIASGSRFAILLTRTDGTSTSVCSVPFPADGLAPTTWGYSQVSTARVASSAPSVGLDVTNSDPSVSKVGMNVVFSV